jgi:hypothetical protein
MADSNGIDWTNPAVQKVFGLDDETSKRMHEMYETIGIEWHARSDGHSCQGRHGVVRHVANADWQKVQRMLEWFMGHGCCRWIADGPGTYAVEFVHMTKVSPAPTKPWEWCGETVLFGDWKAKVEQTRKAVQTFREGQRVKFDHAGRTRYGLVASVNEKTVSVIVEGEGRWRCSPGGLTKI